MYINIPNNIRIACINGHIVCLDLKKDKYEMLNEKKLHGVFEALVKCEFSLQVMNSKYPKNISEAYHKSLKQLEKYNILFFQKQCSEDNYKRISIYKCNRGTRDITWRPSNNIKVQDKVFYYHLAKAMLVLGLVLFFIKTKNIYFLINYIRKLKKKNTQSYFSKEQKLLEKVDNTVKALRIAMVFLPGNGQCLEWSISLTILLLWSNIDANLNVGIQLFPFRSHAWVSLDNEVVADSQFFVDELAIILKE